MGKLTNVRGRLLSTVDPAGDGKKLLCFLYDAGVLCSQAKQFDPRDILEDPQLTATIAHLLEMRVWLSAASVNEYTCIYVYIHVYVGL